ncbi:MAG: thiol:disulfide interchange protein, partial [Prevotella sp.]|nr:thiol:disulfide interchange protein [Prevotella sp.]
MNKQTIITILLALVAMTGLAQTKTATITGYSPALKDGTVAESSIDNVRVASDTVQSGHFTL